MIPTKRAALSNSEILVRHDGAYNWVTSMGISPEGNLLATGAMSCNVYIWDLLTGKMLHTVDHMSSKENICGIDFLCFHRSLPYLAYNESEEGILRFLKTTTWESFFTLSLANADDDSYGILALSNTGPLIAASTDTRLVVVLDIVTKKEIMVVRTGVCTRVYPWTLSFSNTSELVCITWEDGKCDICSIPSGKIVHKFSSRIHYASFSASAPRLVTANFEGEIATWDAATFCQYFQRSTGLADIRDFAYSPATPCICVRSSTGLALVWDYEKDEILASIETAQQSTPMCFSGDGSYLLFGDKCCVRKVLLS